VKDVRETIVISEFKAKCLGILRRVQETGRPVIVTRRGQRIAEIHPPAPVESGPEWLGSFADRGQILLAAPNATLWLSPMSVWETSLLVERGRLEVDTDARTWIQDAIESSGVTEAPVNHEVALQSREVLVKHDDPADRFIAATASVYQLTLVTADERLLRGKGYETIRA